MGREIVCKSSDVCLLAGSIGPCYLDGQEECKAYESRLKQAPKNDQDNYSKVSYSLVPWEILSEQFKAFCDEDIELLAKEVHTWLNGDSNFVVQDLFDLGLSHIDIKWLACSLGYGTVKYYRDSWMKGFGKNPNRILEACLRHCVAYLRGEEFDGEVIEGYPEGLPHLGGVLFNLMVATEEVKQ